jgi:glutamyl-tRNA synthetase/glutamyl-Q tRNA(Asp) synthetase
MEDHDLGRCRRDYEEAIFADLAWIGFTHDNSDFRFAVNSTYRQSDASAHFESKLSELIASGQVYACNCSRQEILLRNGDAQAEELRYDGYCRTRSIPLDAPDVGLRLQIPNTELQFEDLRLGVQTQTPAAQCGDLLLKDRHGQYTYNFAVVVDDLRQGINLVIRGEDVLHATGRQLWLANKLGGRNTISYFHHPLIRGDNGQKLSKRLLDSAIASRRLAGEDPNALLGEAAHAVGLLQAVRPLTVLELPQLLSTHFLNRGGRHGGI